LNLAGRDLDRGSVKIMNFQSLYGGGVPAISKKLGCSTLEAKEFKAFHDRALPGRKALDNEIKKIVRNGDPIRTLGGRLYYVEPPSFSKEFGRVTSWEYKLINYITQGSAADYTKEVLCQWYEGGGASNGTRFLLTVYDEINLSSPQGREADESMKYLREVMDYGGIKLDVPMRSSGKRGLRWGSLEKCP
jgi:DNA polymerase I-like protein with 3'-5' exonuclease and polymerase domains